MHEYKNQPYSDDVARWADPGLDHANLELIETKSGHSWERTPAGDIQLVTLGRQCKGPVCRCCGFSFCLACVAQDGIKLAAYEAPGCSNSLAENLMFELRGSIRVGHLVLHD